MACLVLAAAAISLVGCAGHSQHPKLAAELFASERVSSSASDREKSIVWSSSANLMVENGAAYDCAELVVPDWLEMIDTENGINVVRSKAADRIEIYLRKTQAWMGHTSTKSSIADRRDHMGIVAKRSGKRLKYVSYGGWSSMEGGAYVDALIIVPDRLRSRAARGIDNRSLEELQAKGWSEVPTRADPDRNFEGAGAKVGQTIGEGLRVMNRDLSTVTLIDESRAATTSGDGKVGHLAGAMRDITASIEQAKTLVDSVSTASV